MIKKPLAGALTALVLLVAVTSASAQEAVPQAAPQPVPTAQPQVLLSQKQILALEQKAAKSLEGGEYAKAAEHYNQLHEQRPYTADYMVNFIRAASLEGMKTPAYNMMLKMQRQGLSYDFNQTEDTQNIRGTELYEYLNDLMIRANQPMGEAAVAFRLPGKPSDYASMAWDETGRRLLVGTVSEGKLIAIDENGDSEVLLQADESNGLWSVSGIAVDALTGRLWIASSATAFHDGVPPVDQSQGGLFEFDLRSLELLGKYLLPVDALNHDLGSVAVTKSGHVYVVDRGTPIVYRKVPGVDRIEGFVGSKQLIGFTDISVTPDNSRLYIADSTKGVFIVDPKGQQATMMAAPETLNQGGIDGLEWVNGKLIIIQGGMLPQRIMRLELDDKGTTADSVSPMAIAITEFDRPGIGAVSGSDLLYFANSGEEDPQAGAVIMRTALDAGKEIISPDLQKVQEDIRKKWGQ
jgi:hypothetical protein